MALDAALTEAVGKRTGTTPNEDWLETAFAEVMATVRLIAPCKRETWQDYSDLDPDVQAILVACLSRLALNPRGIRQETIGEYSYTLAAGANPSGPFTEHEARIIIAASGCAGFTGSVEVTPPPVLSIEAPEVSNSLNWPGVL